MFGCYNSVMLYGFHEGSRCSILDCQWLDENYPEVKIAALNIVRNCLGEACYGVYTSVGSDGKLIIDPQDKACIDKLWHCFYQFHANAPLVNTSQHGKYSTNDVENNIESDEVDSINSLPLSGPRSPCFMTAVMGDFETTCHETYTLSDGYNSF